MYELSTKNDWEKAVAGLRPTFLQSWEWGQMQAAMGHPVYRLAFDGGVMTAIVLNLGFGRNVLFAPNGPVGDSDIQALAQSEFIKKIARENNCIALRVEPKNAPSGLNHVIDVTPSVTSVLDLSQPEEQLLAGMKSKTRYNIRLAEKKGVEISFQTEYTEELLDHWWELVEETSKRHGIAHHAKSYYDTMLRTLMSEGMMEVGQAHHEGDLLGMTLNVTYDDTYTYVHGANTHAKKNFMAPYALQWAAVQRAKQQESARYDFYGIAPQDTPHHPLAGVTRFKTGFGGRIHTSPGTFEYGVSPVYPLYRLYRAIKH